MPATSTTSHAIQHTATCGSSRFMHGELSPHWQVFVLRWGGDRGGGNVDFLLKWVNNSFVINTYLSKSYLLYQYYILNIIISSEFLMTYESAFIKL